MRAKGWVRLWIVLTLLGVPLVSELQFQSESETWNDLDKITIEQCVNQEFNNPSHPDALECGRKLGVYKTFFERENIKPALYWAESLGFSFLIDCFLTALIIGVFLVARWVLRGFATAR